MSFFLTLKNEPFSKEVEIELKAEKVKPKLRGGAKQPKLFKVDGTNSRAILTVLRSLDIFQNIDHEKCPMTTKAELCAICLTRSLVITITIKYVHIPR